MTWQETEKFSIQLLLLVIIGWLGGGSLTTFNIKQITEKKRWKCGKMLKNKQSPNFYIRRVKNSFIFWFWFWFCFMINLNWVKVITMIMLCDITLLYPLMHLLAKNKNYWILYFIDESCINSMK